MALLAEAHGIRAQSLARCRASTRACFHFALPNGVASMNGARRSTGCRMFRTLPLVGLLAVLASSRGAAAQQNDAATQPVPAPAPEAFAIFPWDQIKPTVEAFKEAKECGFNLAGFVHAEDLDKVSEAGMKC